MNEEQLIEFVNWLPSVVPEFKDATPDQIVQALNQMSESDEGQQMLSQLINTFQQAKQSADSQMFKKGGKLAAFVSKYGKGGEMCCKKKAILQGGMVNKVAEKMQDGGKTRLDKKLNEILRTEGDKISYQNVPEGVFSQESWKWKNLRRDALGTGRNPVGSFSRVIINSGTPKADTTYTFMPLTDPRDYIDTNADFITVSRKNAEDVAKYSDFLNNFDAIVDKYSTPETMQEGGEMPSLTRREAREQAAANRGFSRGQFQMAMANAKNALRNTGLRGRDLRQQARQMVAGEPEIIEETRPVFQGIERVNNGLESMLPGKASALSSTGIITREVEQPSFGDIFARARLAGAKEFLYNGKRYNTLYKEELPYPGVDPKYNFRTPWSAGYTDLDLARQGTGYYVTAPEYQKDGGSFLRNAKKNK